MNLWLDDIRPAPEGWRWVKTAPEAVAWLGSGDVEVLSLDHDLCSVEALPHMPDWTGYDVICWLERHPTWWPENGVRVHSMNPAGAARIQDVIDRHGRVDLTAEFDALAQEMKGR